MLLAPQRGLDGERQLAGRASEKRLGLLDRFSLLWPEPRPGGPE